MEEEVVDNSEMPSDELERARKIVLDYLENEGKKEKIALAFPNQNNVGDDIIIDNTLPVDTFIYEAMLPSIIEEEKREVEKIAIEKIQKEKDIIAAKAKEQEDKERERREEENKKKDEIEKLKKDEAIIAAALVLKNQVVSIQSTPPVILEKVINKESVVGDVDKKKKDVNFFPKGLFTIDAIITYLLILVLISSCFWMLVKYWTA